ncbi:PAS domain-containing protein [Mycobacterium sp. B14F4]|uniref:PAS domain-containing protein n=1 Tax=Mycobacterium sp. B14F4 TaxID=3153565 RepID=UPI00325E5EB4
MERRRQIPKSPMAVLRELPALVVLDRLPVPVLAIAEDGAIVFANAAFADMLGYPPDGVKDLEFRKIFHTMPPDESAVSVMHAHANLIVELLHEDGSVVRARMSKSALQRGNDPVALATFQDLTERLWVDEI